MGEACVKYALMFTYVGEERPRRLGINASSCTSTPEAEAEVPGHSQPHNESKAREDYTMFVSKTQINKETQNNL